jgi:flavin reductase (DIM6/NTAB) family NADH-FMN oxidoreductase RutF
MKDTLANIMATEQFVVNIISSWFVEAANHTCGNYDPGVNEFDLAGLTPLASAVVKPPRVAESALHMECELRHHWHVKNSKERLSFIQPAMDGIG